MDKTWWILLVVLAFLVGGRAGAAEPSMFRTANGIAVVDRVGVDRVSLAVKLDKAYDSVTQCMEAPHRYYHTIVVLVHKLEGLYGFHARYPAFSLVVIEVQEKESHTAHIAKHEFLHHVLAFEYGGGDRKHQSRYWEKCIGSNWASLE